MASPRQTDFSAGEIDNLLHARTGAEFYAKACRTLLNFIVTKQGIAMSRPGTTLVGEVVGSPVDLSGFISLEDSLVDRTVLIPFNAADDESFVLVVQPNKIQLVTRGGYVESSPGNRYTIVTPYEEEDLRQLHYAQVGEVLTLVCPNWDAYEVRHVSDAPPTWSFERAVTAPPETSFVHINDQTNPAVGFCLVDGDGTPDAALPAADADHPAREWKWKVSSICRENATGRLYETMAVDVTEKYGGAEDPSTESYDDTHELLTVDHPKNLFVLYLDKTIILRLADEVGLTPPAADADTLVAYNIYRGRGELFGFIGQTTSGEFVDVGDEPNYGIQPPIGTNPFGVNQEATGVTEPLISDEEVALGQVVRRYDRASAVAYFENRRVFGGLTRRESDVLASVQGDYDNFDERKLFHIAGESVTFTIAARRRGRIRHLVSMDRLLTLTTAASYSGGGGGDSPLDFDSVFFPLIEEVGSNDVTPVVVDRVCFFARAKGRGLRGLAFTGRDSGFEPFDASALAGHLFRGADKDIIDLTYAEDPWSTIWAVRSDGVLLSLTFDRQQQMLAWARHETDGEVEAVCAVPEGDEDAVYLVVARTIGGVVHRYVERMTSRHERGGVVLSNSDAVVTPPDYVCLDSALSYVGAAAQVFTGLSHLEGKEVYVLREGQEAIGPFTVTGGQIDVGAQLPVNVTDVDRAPAGPRLVAYIGLLYTPDLELLDIAGGEARAKNKNVTHVGFEVDNAKGVKVGPSFDALDDQPDRTVQAGFGTQPLRTEFVFTPVRGVWDYSARACLRQSLPLPVTVLGITRRIAAGGLQDE